MDRICSAVFEKICSLSAVGRYVIFSEDEFLEVFPDGAEKNDAELQKALKKLVSGGYIDLKYSGGNLYCASPLKKYEPEAPAETVSVPVVQSDVKPEKRNTKINFFSAFAGGALGSLIISLIFAFLRC